MLALFITLLNVSFFPLLWLAGNLWPKPFEFLKWWIEKPWYVCSYSYMHELESIFFKLSDQFCSHLLLLSFLKNSFSWFCFFYSWPICQTQVAWPFKIIHWCRWEILQLLLIIISRLYSNVWFFFQLICIYQYKYK